METVQVVRCQLCQSEFNGHERMPMILPCSHNVCYTCTHDYFSKNRSIRCMYANCQQVHNVHPASLKQDDKMLSFIEQRAFSNIVSLLQNKYASVRSAHGQLVKQQSIFMQQVMKHISDYIFKDSLQLQKELQQTEKAIKLLYNQLRAVQGQKNYQARQLLIQEIGQRSQPLEQSIQRLLVETQRIYQLKSQVNSRVFEELESQKLNIKQVNQVCLNFQNQIQQLGQQIQDFQLEKARLEEQLQALQISNQQQQQQQQIQQQIQHQREVGMANLPKVQMQISYDQSQGNISLLFLDQVISGHTSEICSLAVSPDNKYIISGSGEPESSIKIWNFQEGTLHRTLEGHSSDVNSVIISTDQKWLISASVDKTIKIWNFQEGTLHRTLEGHSHYVNSVIISTDQKWLISASFDRTIKIWNFQEYTLHRTIEAHSYVTSVVISTDQKWLISASNDSTIKI